MRNLVLVTLTWLALQTTALAQEAPPQAPSLGQQARSLQARPTPSASSALRLSSPTAVEPTPLPDPDMYATAQPQGLKAFYRRTETAPALAVVTDRSWRVIRGGVTLDVTPAARFTPAGPSAGATVQLEIPAARLAVSHMSFVGTGSSHFTRADFSATSRFGVRAEHFVAQGAPGTLKVGPTLRLVEQIRLWYAVSPSGHGNTLMLTGTARF